VVEPAAVRLAAERASPQDIEEIERAFAGMKEAVENGGDYVTFDLRFHNGLLSAARNRMLAQMSKALSALLRTSFEISTAKTDGPALSLPLHRAVLDAVIAHDPAKAERAVIRLIDGARQDIEDVLGSRRRLPRLSRPPPRLKGRRPGEAHRLVGQGLLQGEDDALFAAIKKYEEKNKNVKIELSQYPIQDMIPKTVAALDSGSPPDVAYADVYDFQVTGKWAFDGKLEDISSVINPITDRFAPNTLETTFLYNDQAKKRAYYAFPIKQQTMHIEYWKDMLDEAGFKESDIPKGWKDYWSSGATRCSPPTARKRQAHLRHRPAAGRGLQRLVLFVPDLHGRLQRQAGQRQRQAAGRRPEGARRPDRRADRLHRALHQGLLAAVVHQLEGPGQQRRLPQQDDVLTHNATISIAAKWLDDMNNASLTALNSAEAKKNYTERIRTAGFPNKPDGSKMVYRTRGEDRRGLQGRQEQGARQGVRGLPAAGRKPDAVRRGFAGPLVPGDQDRAAARSGRPTRTASRSTTSTPPAP
jgi:hypothetical protein